MLKDFIIRFIWGIPVLHDFLMKRKEHQLLNLSSAEIENLRSKLTLRPPIDFHKQTLNWAIKTAAPSGSSGLTWGDVYFADELANALKNLGQKVRVDRNDKVISEDSIDDDVVLVLRGLEPTRPQPGALNIIWVLSHPNRITTKELKKFDLILAASNSWNRRIKKKSIITLLQATNPRQFHPKTIESEKNYDLLFIGNTRNRFRTIIKDLISIGFKPTIYGKGWNKFVPEELIAGSFIANKDLPEYYRSARVVLNDHWVDMARQGFVSNRLFDAVSTGAYVVSDYVKGGKEIFGDLVAMYKDKKDLSFLISESESTAFYQNPNKYDIAIKFGLDNSFDERAKQLLLIVKSYSSLMNKQSAKKSENGTDFES